MCGGKGEEEAKPLRGMEDHPWEERWREEGMLSPEERRGKGAGELMAVMQETKGKGE